MAHLRKPRLLGQQEYHLGLLPSKAHGRAAQWWDLTRACKENQGNVALASVSCDTRAGIRGLGEHCRVLTDNQTLGLKA